MKGHYGPYGGQFVPETLMPTILELETEARAALSDDIFLAELDEQLEKWKLPREGLIPGLAILLCCATGLINPIEAIPVVSEKAEIIGLIFSFSVVAHGMGKAGFFDMILDQVENFSLALG